MNSMKTMDAAMDDDDKKDDIIKEISSREQISPLNTLKNIENKNSTIYDDQLKPMASQTTPNLKIGEDNEEDVQIPEEIGIQEQISPSNTLQMVENNDSSIDDDQSSSFELQHSKSESHEWINEPLIQQDSIDAKTNMEFGSQKKINMHELLEQFDVFAHRELREKWLRDYKKCVKESQIKYYEMQAAERGKKKLPPVITAILFMKGLIKELPASFNISPSRRVDNSDDDSDDNEGNCADDMQPKIKKSSQKLFSYTPALPTKRKPLLPVRKDHLRRIRNLIRSTADDCDVMEGINQEQLDFQANNDDDEQRSAPSISADDDFQAEIAALDGDLWEKPFDQNGMTASAVVETSFVACSADKSANANRIAKETSSDEDMFRESDDSQGNFEGIQGFTKEIIGACSSLKDILASNDLKKPAEQATDEILMKIASIEDRFDTLSFKSDEKASDDELKAEKSSEQPAKSQDDFSPDLVRLISPGKTREKRINDPEKSSPSRLELILPEKMEKEAEQSSFEAVFDGEKSISWLETSLENDFPWVETRTTGFTRSTPISATLNGKRKRSSSLEDDLTMPYERKLVRNPFFRMRKRRNEEKSPESNQPTEKVKKLQKIGLKRRHAEIDNGNQHLKEENDAVFAKKLKKLKKEKPNRKIKQEKTREITVIDFTDSS